jgi:hypothetical protein
MGRTATPMLASQTVPYDIKEASRTHAHAHVLHCTAPLTCARAQATLESLLDMARLPWFFLELFLNFDCQPYACPVFESLFLGERQSARPARRPPDGAPGTPALCKQALPANGALTGNHVLALRCVLETLRSLSQVRALACP